MISPIPTLSELQILARALRDARRAITAAFEESDESPDDLMDAEQEAELALVKAERRLASGPDLSEGEAQVTAAMRQAGAEVLARMYLDGRGSESRGDGALMVYLAMERKRREG